MFIDHVHEMFNGIGIPNWVDWFGRPVATIFFFLSVEGFIHTHNQKRYLSRLLVGFWVMQIGSLIVQHFFKLGSFGLINNIFGDLFIGVLTMYGLQTISQGHQNHQAAKVWEGILIIPTVDLCRPDLADNGPRRQQHCLSDCDPTAKSLDC